MKKIDIPQEENKAAGGVRKVMYAPDESGDFKKFNYGSSVEEYATSLAVNEYIIQRDESLENIKKGISSPIEYYMYDNRLDVPTLSSIVGMFQFRVKRHLLAKNFKKLNNKILSKYALAFNIELKDLKEFSYE